MPQLLLENSAYQVVWLHIKHLYRLLTRTITYLTDFSSNRGRVLPGQQ